MTTQEKILPELERISEGLLTISVSSQVIYDRLQTSAETISAFCEKWQIVELAIFGSVLRDNFRSEGENQSDIDILFTLADGVSQSLLKRVRIQHELEELFHRKVDLIDREEVTQSYNWIRRDNIVCSEQVIYAMGRGTE
jgi:predicted nucleotidyltransferase